MGVRTERRFGKSAEIAQAIERLLAPYVLRKDDPSDTHPAEARWVRVLRYTLPAADPEAPGGPAS